MTTVMSTGITRRVAIQTLDELSATGQAVVSRGWLCSPTPSLSMPRKNISTCTTPEEIQLTTYPRTSAEAEPPWGSMHLLNSAHDTGYLKSGPLDTSL